MELSPLFNLKSILKANLEEDVFENFMGKYEGIEGFKMPGCDEIDEEKVD